MKHYLRDLFLAGLALLALSSCHSADPEKEAEKLNEQFTELINSIDTNASPYTRYKYLLKIKDTADSLFSKGRTGFKKKKLALYRQNVIEITDRQEYKDAWASMSEDNKAKMSAFPSNVWMINAENLTANTIFKMDNNHETITPYNIKGSITLKVNGNGLVYSSSYYSPVFFEYDDSTKLFSILTANGETGHFRKALRRDLSLGHYECVRSYDTNFDGYEVIDVNSDNVFIHGDNHNVEVVDEIDPIWGEKLQVMNISDIGKFCFASRYSRVGCYDCWVLIDTWYKLNHRWERVLEDGARNFLFIFGKSKDEWATVQKTTSYSGKDKDDDDDDEWDLYDDEDWEDFDEDDFEDAIDDLKDYVDQYVEIYKKAQDGDVSVVTEYLKFLKKAKQLSDKIDKMEGKLSKAQDKKYRQILKKMTDAMQDS